MTRVRSQLNPCESCGRQSDNRRDLSPSTSIFPCHYNSTNAPYSSSCYSYQDSRAKSGNLPKSNALSQNALERKLLSLFTCLRTEAWVRSEASKCEDSCWTQRHWDRRVSQYSGGPLSVSFHRIGRTTSSYAGGALNRKVLSLLFHVTGRLNNCPWSQVSSYCFSTDPIKSKKFVALTKNVCCYREKKFLGTQHPV